jgi:hypothetical protein
LSQTTPPDISSILSPSAWAAQISGIFIGFVLLLGVSGVRSVESAGRVRKPACTGTM